MGQNQELPALADFKLEYWIEEGPKEIRIKTSDIILTQGDSDRKSGYKLLAG